MSMKGGDAQIQIDPWSATGGSKGELQQGWFRVVNIPDDQISIITLAKVGGLVGKVTEIDEKARFRVHYVRLKIACRDVSNVPKTVEGTLGMSLYDFGFEREIFEEGNEKILKSGIKISEDQPPNKKHRAKMGTEFAKLNKTSGTSTAAKPHQSKNSSKQIMMSCSPKMQYKPSDCGGSKLMKDAQKACTSHNENEGGDRVYIPENIKESDSKSDSFSGRLRKLNEEGQSSKQNDKSEQLWFMNMSDINTVVTEKKSKISVEDIIQNDKGNENLLKDITHKKVSVSPEVFLTDDNFIHTQESQTQESDVLMEEVIP